MKTKAPEWDQELNQLNFQTEIYKASLRQFELVEQACLSEVNALRTAECLPEKSDELNVGAGPLRTALNKIQT